MLVELAEDFPLLSALVEKRAGGQKKLPIGRPSGEADLLALTSVNASLKPGPALPETPAPEGEPETPPAEPGAAPSADPAPPPDSALLPGNRGPRRPIKYGLSLQFERRPDDPELGRLLESTVWINEAHPAYLRAAASRSEGYHVALAAAMALSSVAVEPGRQRAFVNAFFTRWGEGLDRRPRNGRKKR